jgi:putative transposase
MAPSRISFVLALEITDRGRPPIPPSLQTLIATMARANRTWGEERIAAELLVKLAISVSPRTVRRYMCRPVPSRPRPSSQTWRTFLRNHAGEILACDFFVTVTATVRLVYVFLVLDIDTRRILHWNVTERPTAEWTVQQFRACLTGDESYRFIIHARDSIYSAAADRAISSMGLRVLKTPARVPQANAFCERLIGTARRECLDQLVPLNERHLRKILAGWVSHITIEVVPTRVSVLGFLSGQRRLWCHDQRATTFRTDMALLPDQVVVTGSSGKQDQQVWRRAPQPSNDTLPVAWRRPR